MAEPTLPWISRGRERKVRWGRRRSRTQGSDDRSGFDLCLALELPLAGWSPPTSSSRQTCSRTLWGKGVLEAATAAHILRCLQLFMGIWKSCLPAWSSLAVTLCRMGARCSSVCASWGTQVSSSGNNGATGKAWPPPMLDLAPGVCEGVVAGCLLSP